MASVAFVIAKSQASWLRAINQQLPNVYHALYKLLSRLGALRDNIGMCFLSAFFSQVSQHSEAHFGEK